MMASLVVPASQCMTVSFITLKGGLDIAFHTHVIYEDQGNVMNSKAIYNNAIHDNYAGLNINVDYGTAIYNNVMWNNLNNVAIYLNTNALQDKVLAAHSQ